jgi:uncharacterized protein YcfJ
MNAGMTVLTLAASALVAAEPAYADPPRWAPAHGHRHAREQVVVVKHTRHHRPAPREVVVVRQPVVVRRTVVVERPVYVERPVCYGVPTLPAAVVYAAVPSNQVLNTLGGAIIGAAVGSQFGSSNGRTAATAIGAVIGGVIGSGL